MESELIVGATCSIRASVSAEFLWMSGSLEERPFTSSGRPPFSAIVILAEKSTASDDRQKNANSCTTGLAVNTVNKLLEIISKAESLQNWHDIYTSQILNFRSCDTLLHQS